MTIRPCEGNADFCDFARDYPPNIVPDPRFQAISSPLLIISSLILVMQAASLIKRKIFHTGSFDSSVNDVDVTKRFNFGERKERACKVRHHLDLTMTIIRCSRCDETSSTLKRRETARALSCSLSTRTLLGRLSRFNIINILVVACIAIVVVVVFVSFVILKVEQCLDEGSECLTDSDAPSSGTTVCRQEYATHR